MILERNFTLRNRRYSSAILLYTQIYLTMDLLPLSANIPRIISASYAGSEVGEFDIYAPYSYYGSEAGGDVATDINDSVWGMPQVSFS